MLSPLSRTSSTVARGASSLRFSRPAQPVRGEGGISVSGLTKTYERIVGRQLARTHALREIDFAVAPHEFVSIIGPSGCGKSTVMRIIAGSCPAAAVRYGFRTSR